MAMDWRSTPDTEQKYTPSRRQLLIGGATGGALVVGFVLWPRRYVPNLSAVAGEAVFNGYLKIGSDGHIIVVVPQIELGEASSTLLPQVVADELGADWRTVGVEFAPLNGYYANAAFFNAAGWQARLPFAKLEPQQVTDEALTLEAFEAPMRRAAAEARMRLCAVAGKRWSVPPESCDTNGGFVTHAKQRARFGELAGEAARLAAPDPIVLRQGDSNRLIGISLPRLDAPAKIDGSANFAADIRLPNMVFATIRQGPLGATTVSRFNEVAARKVAGAVDVVVLSDGLACIANTGWAAAKMIDAAAPSFTTRGALAESKTLARRFDAALKSTGDKALTLGDVDAALANGHAESATYSIGLLPHAQLEPLAATARYEKGLLEIWVATQMPLVAREAAARAVSINPEKVVIHSVMGGGSFGRRFEIEIVAQVANLAVKLKRPVQLFWSRGEDMMHDRFGGAMAAKLTAQILPNGEINAWKTELAAPATLMQLKARTLGGQSADAALHATEGAIDVALINSAQPPYAVSNFGLSTHPLNTGIPTGPMRGGAAFGPCFFNESFLNELSAKTGVEPFSLRMALAGNNPRLTQCLAKVAALGGWSGGGQGATQGIACYASTTAFVAVIAEAKMGEDGRVHVSKLTAVADVGQLINPDITRQQIEGGLLFGVGLATGASVSVARGIAGPLRLGALHLPRLTDMLEIDVELIPSNAPSADAWEIAVPPVAPAIAGALFAGSGKRFRDLPFSLGA